LEGCDRERPAGRLKYCSPVCAQKGYNSRRKQPALAERECLFCHHLFPPSSEKHLYCNPECNISAYNEQRRTTRAKSGDSLFGISDNVNVDYVQDVKEGEFALYLADGHGIFRDVNLHLAIDRAIGDFQPDRIFYGGDHFVDFYDISMFDKNPTRRFNLQDEITYGICSLDYHASIAPSAKRYFLGGNHEDRLRRYLWQHPELAPLEVEDTGEPMLNVPSLFHLQKRNVQYIPFPGRLDYQGFVITHGPGGRRGGLQMEHVAKWMAEYIRSSGCCFHFHRQQSFGFNNDQGLPGCFYAVGCTCRLDPPYDPFPKWQQGFAYSRVLDGKVHFTSVSIFGRAFLVEGRAYKY
jgi:hypothetical protein